jgi:hypothetical protein
MNIEEFKKAKAEIKEKNFFNNYRGFSKLSYYLSWVGNGFSILFAYFFINNIIQQTITTHTATTDILAGIITVIILLTVELMKRFVFDKLTQNFIIDQFKLLTTESKLLAFISICLIVTSFYFSLNGAEKYADKTDDISTKTENTIQMFSDTLDKKYAIKTATYDEQNKILFEQNQKLDTELSEYSKLYNSPDISKADARKLKSEINRLTKQKEYNQGLIDKNDSKIKEFTSLKDAEIKEYEIKHKGLASKEQEKVSGNPMIFLVFSTVIEFLILFGIYFINYYKVRSVDDFEKKIAKDPKYKLYNLYSEMINVMYKEDTNIGDAIPIKAQITKLLKSNSVDISNKDLDEALRVLTHLNIFKQKGNKKYFSADKNEANELIKKHLKIV